MKPIQFRSIILRIISSFHNSFFTFTTIPIVKANFCFADFSSSSVFGDNIANTIFAEAIINRIFRNNIYFCTAILNGRAGYCERDFIFIGCSQIGNIITNIQMVLLIDQIEKFMQDFLKPVFYLIFIQDVHPSFIC